jgi:hypothetical protein
MKISIVTNFHKEGNEVSFVYHGVIPIGSKIINKAGESFVVDKIISQNNADFKVVVK